jgi:hypothetical protein
MRRFPGLAGRTRLASPFLTVTNAGAGYGLFQFNGARAWGYNSTSLKNAEVYNDTVYLSPSSSGSPMAVYIESGTQNLHFRDNIFHVSGGLQLAYIKGTQTGLLFQGNDYWSFSALSAYQLAPGSPLINAGINLSQFAITAGQNDFYGDPIPDKNSGLFDIGADEAA